MTSNETLLHIHFGTGRLGLGLVAPFFQREGSELYLLNRSVAQNRETTSCILTSQKRNEILQNHPDKSYYIQKPNAHTDSERHTIKYTAFYPYDEDSVEQDITSILKNHEDKKLGVVVSGAILNAKAYRSVIKALGQLCKEKEKASIGGIFFVACENTLTAEQIFKDEAVADLMTDEIRSTVVCVKGMVDRICMDIHSDTVDGKEAVVVFTEDYGRLTLELKPETEDLAKLCKGSKVDFTRFIDAERQIKSWLLNGTHSLVAINAFHSAHGDKDLKLNEYLNETPEHKEFAGKILKEIRDGVSYLLKKEPQYAEFVKNNDVDAYLNKLVKVVLERYSTAEDPVARILSRFRTPSPEQVTQLQDFTQRFLARLDEPLSAYEEYKGTTPDAVSHSIFNLLRLVATGTFIDVDDE